MDFPLCFAFMAHVSGMSQSTSMTMCVVLKMYIWLPRLRKCCLHMQVEDLSAIAEATNYEVTLANLGPRFTDAAAELLEQLPQSHGTGT